MKTFGKINSSINRVLVLSIVAGIQLLSSSANAQMRSMYAGGRSNSSLSVSIDGGVSARSFKIKSDVEAINKLNVVEEGWSAGLTVGGKSIRGRVVFGNYKASTTVGEEIGQKTYTTQFNVYPLSAMGIKSKYFKPYILAGVDINSIKFFGTAIPRNMNALAMGGGQGGQGSGCTCTCDDGGPMGDPDLGTSNSGGAGNSGASSDSNGNPSGDPDLMDGSSTGSTDGMADPDLLPEEPARVKPWENKLTATQAVIGLGFEISYKKRGRVYHMFSEVRYGIQLGSNTVYKAMVNTTISNQVAINVGIGIGISK